MTTWATDIQLELGETYGFGKGFDYDSRLVTAFRPWLEAQLSRIPRGSKLAEDIRYALGLWPGLTRSPEDGRLELDANPVENQIRPLALAPKNALFAGHEVGGENRAMLDSLIAACRMSDKGHVATGSPRGAADADSGARRPLRDREMRRRQIHIRVYRADFAWTRAILQ